MAPILFDCTSCASCLRALLVLIYGEASMTVGAVLFDKAFLWPFHLVFLVILSGLLALRVFRWQAPFAALSLLVVGALASSCFAVEGGPVGWWFWSLATPVFAVLAFPWGLALLVPAVLDLVAWAVGHPSIPYFLQSLSKFRWEGWPIFLWVQASAFGLALLMRRQSASREELTRAAQDAVQIDLLETLIDLIPLPLFYKDKDGRFLSGNVSFCVVFDVPKESLVAHTNKEVFPPTNATVFDKIELEVLSRESMAAEEVELLHADGTLHSFIVYLLRFQAPESSESGFLGVLIDITSRKEREQKLEALNATKDRLFSIISHDLRGPVGKVKQLLDIYVDDPTLFDAPTWGQVFQDMRRSTHSLLQLLENLLSWARTQKRDYVAHLEAFPIDPMVNEIFSLFHLTAQEKEITLEAKLDLPFQIHTDKAMMATILRNLVHNAVKFTRKGGKVTVGARETPDGVEISVADNGVGINPENLSKLLDRGESFTTPGTSKEKGQGLGLSVCFDLARLLGTRLDAVSVVGQGTTFRLFLAIPELEFLGDAPLDEV